MTFRSRKDRQRLARQAALGADQRIGSGDDARQRRAVQSQMATQLRYGQGLRINDDHRLEVATARGLRKRRDDRIEPRLGHGLEFDPQGRIRVRRKYSRVNLSAPAWGATEVVVDLVGPTSEYDPNALVAFDLTANTFTAKLGHLYDCHLVSHVDVLGSGSATYKLYKDGVELYSTTRTRSGSGDHVWWNTRFEIDTRDDDATATYQLKCLEAVATVGGTHADSDNYLHIEVY